jgi:ribulose-5-phosphate 4-epimerase/fuculose-1-phosphate aldolase
LPELRRQHYTRVTDYSIVENKVSCKGPIKASSESLTHAAIYEMDHRIHAIVHVHHAKLWKALKNKVPTTSSSVPYGTPQMALAVKSLYDHGDLAAQKIFAMAGHEDGLVSFGTTLMEAASIMLGYWRQV